MFIEIAYAHNHIETAQGFIAKINEFFLYPLLTLMMATALLVFLYGCFEYVRDSASDEGRSTGQKHILWGIIGMLIMLSAYSILAIAAGTFNLGGDLDRVTTPTSTLAPAEPSSSSGGTSAAPATSPRPVPRPDTTNTSNSGVPLTTNELQTMVVSDYENLTNINSAFYMRDVRAMTTDIDGVDRIREINLSHYRGYISAETRDALLQAAQSGN